MPLIVTPGGATSNSYVTLAEANALLADELVDTTAWTAATDDDKTRALITSARLINALVRWNFDVYGYALYLYPYVYAYGLPAYFPAAWPVNLQIAQSLYAAWLLGQQAVSPIGAAATSGASDVVSALKVGPISIDFDTATTTAGPVAGSTIPDHVWVRLSAFGTRAGGPCVPLVRT